MANQMLEIYETKPEGFTPLVEVAGCYLEVGGKLLLLKRSQTSSQGGKWGVPAGKVEKGETPEEGARRELFEETGIAVPSGSKVQHVHTLYVRQPHVEFTFHVFKVDVHSTLPVCLNDEHEGFLWATDQEINELPLVAGAREALEIYRAKM
jgi:8-oxo-dGTP pyrophosphatase MutT (NUDIX family)